MIELDFEKLNGLVPAVIQDESTNKVLMVGFMNQEALEKTISIQKATFYSRTKQRLWTKGETSGNFLHVSEIIPDCDKDTLLIKVRPEGPACHTGADTCFSETNNRGAAFINHLESVIQQTKDTPRENSYTTRLFQKGLNKIAQKVGEEAVELVIEAIDRNDERFKEECADLIYHLLVLLAEKDMALEDIAHVLESRHQ